MKTPRPWPPEAYPTPNELADWLEVCTREERLEMAAKVLEWQERSLRCVIANHEDGIEWMRARILQLSLAAEEASDTPQMSE